MKWKISVEIEHTHYTEFLTDTRKSGEIHLTTLKDHQNKADITLSFFSEAEKQKIFSVLLEDLPDKAAGKVDIKIESSIKRRKLYLLIMVDGRQTVKTVISLQHLLPFKFPSWFWIIPGILLLAALIFISVQAFSSFSNRTRAPAAATQAQPQIRQETSKSTEESAEAPEASGSTEESAEAPEASVSTEESAEAPEASTREVSEEPEPVTVHVEFDELLYFDADSTSLDSTAQTQLAQWLREISIAEEGSISIHAHCAPRGTSEGRRKISEGRAEAVRQYIQASPLARGFEILVFSWEDEQPVSTRRAEEHLNRRVELLFEGLYTNSTE